MKERLQKEPASVHRIFQQEQSAFTQRVGNIDMAAAKFPQFEDKQSCLYKNRSKQFSPLPKTIDELKIFGQFLVTETGLRFFLSHTKEKNKVLRNKKRVEEMEHTLTFVSDVGLQVLAASKRWHSDGTFDTAVEMHEENFYQFYMIHGLYKNEMIPCVPPKMFFD